VIQEIFRVLDSGGRFLVWDLEIPKCLDETKEIVAAYLTIKLPGRKIQTGYGTKWPDRVQGITYYREIAERVGFILENQETKNQVFHLELKKL